MLKRRFYFRKLERNGYCSQCRIPILKDTSKVMVFINNKAHYDRVILCESCCHKFVECFKQGLKEKL
jgi:hypothetical protein